MIVFHDQQPFLEGPLGRLPLAPTDEITLKLAMLFEGQCEGLGPQAAAEKFGLSRPRYYQLLHLYLEQGAGALQSRKRGPQTHYRRTDEVVRQVIRLRFLDPDASAPGIAQKLNQTGWAISARSVERIVEEYGLQKKTLHLSP